MGEPVARQKRLSADRERVGSAGVLPALSPVRSFFRLLNVDPGLNSTNVLTIGMPIATERFPDPARLNQYLREIRTAVEAVPGVRPLPLVRRGRRLLHRVRARGARGGVHVRPLVRLRAGGVGRHPLPALRARAARPRPRIRRVSP